MAYCLIHGQPFICDNDRCLPAVCGAAAEMPVLTAPSGGKGDQ
jgi:hypothetical protein